MNTEEIFVTVKDAVHFVFEAAGPNPSKSEYKAIKDLSYQPDLKVNVLKLDANGLGHVVFKTSATLGKALVIVNDWHNMEASSFMDIRIARRIWTELRLKGAVQVVQS